MLGHRSEDQRRISEVAVKWAQEGRRHDRPELTGGRHDKRVLG
jgi:predicted secreted Zn-dependent protease